MTKLYFLLPLLFMISLPSIVLAEDNSSASINVDAQPTNKKALILTVDQYSESVPQNILDSWTSRQSVFSLDPKVKSEFENTDYCPVNKVFCALTLTSIQSQHLRLFPETILNVNAISSYVDDLSRKFNRDPVDAKFKIEDGKVTTFSEEQTGIALDIQKSIVAISDSLRQSPIDSVQTLNLPFNAKKPDLGYADINNLGISSLIGEGVSNFKGSPVNRIHNIKVASERFNGVLIKPGEEFSFVKNLGDVDADHGYLPELVIKQGVTEPEFGGGICQVSTTTFRAAIYAGLEITARRNHAYPVSYYNPQGMDATVYVPQPDLKFKNNTPGYILIQSKIEGTILTFDFYGTNDGRKITVDGPAITERQPDGALKATFTQHVFDKDGKEFITDVFNSSYNSPYKYPHSGGPVLTAKPSNWSVDEWKAYQKTLKDIAKATAKKP